MIFSHTVIHCRSSILMLDFIIISKCDLYPTKRVIVIEITPSFKIMCSTIQVCDLPHSTLSVISDNYCIVTYGLMCIDHKLMWMTWGYKSYRMMGEGASRA